MASPKKADTFSKENDAPPEVLALLINLFGSVLHTDVIKSVGLNCQWNVETASNILAELSSSVSNDRVKPKQRKKSSPANINSVSYGITAEDDDDADVLVEDERSHQPQNCSSIPWLQVSSATNPGKKQENAAAKNPSKKDGPTAAKRSYPPTSKSTPVAKGPEAIGTRRVTKLAADAYGGAGKTPPVNNFAKPNISSVVRVTPTGPVNKPQPVKAVHVHNKSKKEIEYDRVRDHILTGAKVLVLLRGLPGSGKTHLARLLVTTTINEEPQRFIYSTDEYFIQRGVYQYNPNMLQDAHSWNQKRVYEAMMLGMSPIVVDNTHTEMWEMKPYAGYAIQFGYAVEILEPLTVWIFNPPELARRNVHAVPRAKIESMLERYEKKITPDKLFSIYGLRYMPYNHPPQPRLYPPMSRNIKPLFSIPVSIARTAVPPPAPGADAEATKAVQKKRKKKKKKADGASSETSSTLSKSESMHSILSSDNDSDGKAHHVYGGSRDLLSADLASPKNEYELLSSDSASNNGRGNTDNVDLINFNDSDETGDKAKYSSDLINLEGQGSRQRSAASDKPSQQITAALLSSCEALLKSVASRASDTIGAGKSVFDAAVADFPKLDLSSWNLTKETLESWELVDAPQVTSAQNTADNPQPQRATPKPAPADYICFKADSSTNTSSADFGLLKERIQKTPHFEIVPTTSRNIGENCASPLPPLLTRVAVFDKSTMTGHANILATVLSRTRCNQEDQHFTELLHLFPKMRQDVLKEMFDKCQGDINWTVDLLLDCNPDTMETAGESPPSVDTEGTQHVHTSECTCVSDYETQPNAPEAMPSALPATTVAAQEIKRNSKPKPQLTEESLLLKKQLENQIKIDDTHYSGYLLNLRNKKHGEPSPQPSTSKDPSPQYPNYAPDVGHDVMAEGESEESSEEEMIEMNVGSNFVEQLKRVFGDEDLEYPEGVRPVMNLPASMLRQLHACWLESICQQMEAQSAITAAMVREDEEFARKLHEQDATRDQQPAVPDLQEIMDMEIALAIYRTDQEQWKNETPDDLASRMKRQKLFETFPKLDKTILVEILQAHNNSFEQTCEVLMASVGQTSVQLDPEGEIRTANGSVELEKQQELIEKAKREYMQAKQLEEASQKKRSEQSLEDEADCCSHEESAEHYREQAAHHLKMRQQCFSKAQAAYQKGLTQVATYYSDIAKMHIQKYEQANSLAASAFLSAHSLKQQNSQTLDLHFLYVKEAEQALALFIDNHLSRLKESKKSKETLFIITGRGRNSRDGVPHIKLAVKRNLKERNLEFVQINPGLLKVTVRKHSKMTKDLKSDKN